MPLEALAAEREGAVGRIPNGCKVALRDLIGEAAQVASAARLLALGEGAINRVRNDGRIVYRKRLANDAQRVLEVLEPDREAITGLVVESTYNWYWLVDALMAAGYQMHLANTAAIVQYSGLKYSDDDTDAAWLAKLLRLGLLPEGFVYPQAQRAVRDLLCRRSRLVQQRTANVLAVQNLFSRNRGCSISANDIRRLTPERVAELVADANLALALAIQSTLLAMQGQQAAIDLLEREAPLCLAADESDRGLATTAHRQQHRTHPRADHRAGDRAHRALCRGRQLRLLLPQ